MCNPPPPTLKRKFYKILNQSLKYEIELRFVITNFVDCNYFCERIIIQQTPVAPIPIKPPQPVLDTCTQACKDALTIGKELKAEPCLLDPVPQDPNWVCDVVHDPRQPIDNLPENQCQTYRNDTAQYFIEVAPNCKIIKTG